MSDVELERRLAALLRTPTPVRAGVRDEVMNRVREAACVRAPRPRVRARSSRSARHSMIGVLLAASVGSVAVLSTNAPRALRFDDRPSASEDSIFGRLRDTLFLERVLRGGDHRYAFAVDGARWVPDRDVSTVRPADRLPAILRVARDSD